MVQIITDSSCLYTQAQAREMGFEAVPLCVNIKDWQGRDLLMDMDRFYGLIAEGNNPISSQPPVGEVMEMFKKYEGQQIINISMADGLSGTYLSACGVRETMPNKDDITVINTKTLCGPHKYMVEKAAQMQKDGKTAQEIIDWLYYTADHQKSFLIPQDFDFLRRGGRLTPLAATLGSVLKLKPVMTQTEDGRQLEKIVVKRTMSAAFAVVVEEFKKAGVDERHKLYVSHARAPKDAEKAMEMLKEAFPMCETEMIILSPAFVTQGGPGCVAIQWVEK